MSIEETQGLGPLFAALAKAQGEIRGAEKDRTNPHFQQGYATLASIWEACRAALTRNGLAVIQVPEADAQGNVTLRTILGHAGGASIEGTYPVRPTQQTPQGVGSALTYARRYSLASMVGVAPSDAADDDGEGASRPFVPHTPPPEQRAHRMLDALSKAETLAEFDALAHEMASAVAELPEPIRLDVRAKAAALRKPLKAAAEADAAARDAMAREPDPEPPAQAAQRAELAAALRDEPPPDEEAAMALVEPCLKEKSGPEFLKAWAARKKSPEYKAATAGAKRLAEANVASIIAALADEATGGR